ncbi:MAG TPA: JAB domain-containing protein [Ferruginibacter sp.]|nr:JAB domain-containing protein [Ferruginibacter sp.]HRQ20540.1 JAB domain-containing protein [Ferruginibacter sp.]
MFIQKNSLGNFPVKVPEIKISVSYSENFTPKELYKISSSKDAAVLLAGCFTQSTFYFQEEFFILCLNRSNAVLGYFLVSRGGLTGTVADPRVILTVALEVAGTTGIILAHNHPSGNAKPSSADLEITKKIKLAASHLDIILLDHVILCDNSAATYYSFADEGII